MAKLEHYICVGKEKLRCGYTTGTCAAAAARGAAERLLSGQWPAAVEIVTPAGIRIDGGAGVGRVTQPGLDQPVGAAAINSTPRKMILEQLLQALNRQCAVLWIRRNWISERSAVSLP